MRCRLVLALALLLALAAGPAGATARRLLQPKNDDFDHDEGALVSGRFFFPIFCTTTPARGRSNMFADSCLVSFQVLFRHQAWVVGPKYQADCLSRGQRGARRPGHPQARWQPVSTPAWEPAGCRFGSEPPLDLMHGLIPHGGGTLCLAGRRGTMGTGTPVDVNNVPVEGVAEYRIRTDLGFATVDVKKDGTVRTHYVMTPKKVEAEEGPAPGGTVP